MSTALFQDYSQSRVFKSFNSLHVIRPVGNDRPFHGALLRKAYYDDDGVNAELGITTATGPPSGAPAAAGRRRSSTPRRARPVSSNGYCRRIRLKGWEQGISRSQGTPPEKRFQNPRRPL